MLPLGVAALVGWSHTLAAQTAAAPYESLTFRAGVTSAHTYAPLRNFYPGDHGIAVEVETPFEFGLLGIAVDAITMHGVTAQQVTTSTNSLAIDWRREAAFGNGVRIRGGVRVGDFHMTFRDPHFNDPGATNDHSTEEFLFGPTAALDVGFGHALGATLAGAWIYMPTATRTKVAYVTLLGSYKVGTPGWLQRFLQ